jgi:Rod binding domain-containing protein
MDPISPAAPSSQPRTEPVRTAPPADRTEAATRVAREFEAVFLSTVVEGMLKTGQAETFGGGHAEEMWRSVMARAYADQITAAGGIGLAEVVAESISAATSAYRGR